MRVAVIHGPGISSRLLQRFQSARITWLPELPAKAEQFDAILLFGGDGTVHRYLGKLVESPRPTLIVPCGSGNDFARALGLRSIGDALKAWHKFLSSEGAVRTVDVGVISPPQTAPTDAPAPHYFCTVAGIGLDGEVARRANRLPRWLRAHGGYVLSLLPALYSFTPPRVRIEAENCVRDRRVFLAAFANAPAFGGAMKIAPQAELDDGLLDVCIVRELSKLKLLGLFPSVYFGRHLQTKEVEYFHASSLTAEAETPLDVYADGELVCPTPVKVNVLRNALQFIVSPR